MSDPRFPRSQPSTATSNYLALKERLAAERGRVHAGASPASLTGNAMSSSFEWMSTRRQAYSQVQNTPQSQSLNARPMPGVHPSVANVHLKNVWFNNVPKRDWRGNLLQDPEVYWDLRLKAAIILVPMIVLFVFALCFFAGAFAAPPIPQGPAKIVAPSGTWLWKQGSISELATLKVEPMICPAIDYPHVNINYCPISAFNSGGFTNQRIERSKWLIAPEEHGHKKPDVLFIGDSTFNMWLGGKENTQVKADTFGLCGNIYTDPYPEADCNVMKSMFKTIMQSEPFTNSSFEVNAVQDMTTDGLLARILNEEGWNQQHIKPRVIVLYIGAWDITPKPAYRRKSDQQKPWARVPEVQQVAANYRKVVLELEKRWPDAQFLLMPILPRAAVNYKRSNTKNVFLDDSYFYKKDKNEVIPALNTWMKIIGADEEDPDGPLVKPDVHWQDCSHVFLGYDSSGREYIDSSKMPDMMYPNLLGNELLLQCLKEKVHELLLWSYTKEKLKAAGKM